MKNKFKHIESRGLPGGPNEQFTYITGVFSIDGYKSDSPDVNNPFNVIPSGNITTKGVDFDLIGMDNLGNVQYMKPDRDYKFPGDTVFEVPAMKLGGGGRCWPGYTPVPGKKAFSAGSCRKAQYGGNSVTEFPMAQEGAGVNKEGVKQYKWFKNYMRSPKYVERLKKEFPDYTDKQIGQEVKSRLENVMQTRVGFLPFSSDISPSLGSLQGVYNTDEYPGAIMLRPEYSASTSDEIFEPGHYLGGYTTIPLHEWSHAADDGGNRIPQSTTDLMLSKMKENILGLPKDKYYYTKPTEYLGRMQPLRYLMQKEGLYDAGTQDFTKEDLEKAKQNKTIKNNVHFQNLMENVKSDEDFIELMNKVASVNQKDNSKTLMAKQGKAQDGKETTRATLSQYEEPAWYEKALDYLASPMTAFGYSARNQDLPDSIPINAENRNAFDGVIDAINPFAWAKYAASAKRNIDQGEYLDAGFDALGAIPIVPAWLAKGKNVAKNVPVDKLDDLVEVVTANGSVKKIPRKDAIRLNRVEDANVTNTSFTNYEDGNWFADDLSDFYVNRTKNAMSPVSYDLLDPKDPRRLITMYMDPSDAKNFNLTKGVATERALNMSGGMGNMPLPSEYVLPPELVKQIRETGKIPGASTFIGDADQVMKNLTEFYKKYGGDISGLDKAQLGAFLKRLKPAIKKGVNYINEFIQDVAGSDDIVKATVKDVKPNAKRFDAVTEVNPLSRTQAKNLLEQGRNTEIFKAFEEGANTIDDFVKSYTGDLSSPEGFKRLVRQEADYLRSIGFDEARIAAQAEINAGARLNEIINIGNTNRAIAQGERSAKNIVKNKYNFNNASYTQNAEWLDDLFYKPGMNIGSFNLNRTKVGAKVLPGKTNLGTMFNNSKAVAAHEIGGHGLQSGRRLPVDSRLKNLEPLDEMTEGTKEAYRYFIKGSRGKEPSAYLHELRQALLDNKLIRNRYDYVSPELLKRAQTLFDVRPSGTMNTMADKYHSNTRILDFIKPTKANFDLLSRELNKLPAIAPIGIGLGGAAALSEYQEGGQPPFDKESWEYYRQQNPEAVMNPPVNDSVVIPPKDGFIKQEFIENLAKPEFQKPKTLNFNSILDYVVETRGGNRDLWGKAADTIAFHESGPWARMDVGAKQYLGGPGRGLFQFEGPSLKTAQKRYTNIAKSSGFTPNPDILNAKSADQLNAQDQYTLFFANLIESKAKLSDYAEGKMKLEDLWLKGHKNVEKQGDRESFLESLKAAEKEGIKNGYTTFKKGGEFTLYDIYKKYVMGGATDEVSKDIYDKLNRVHYKDAKGVGMSVPNYILTYVMKGS